MQHVNPTDAQRKLIKTLPADKPILMVNLLRYKRPDVKQSKAQYDEYQRRTLAVCQRLKLDVSVPARGLGSHLALIGDVSLDAQWDKFLVVRYGTRDAFLALLHDPEYQQIVRLRTSAIENSRLIPFFDQHTAKL